jgi:hypothetical protein
MQLHTPNATTFSQAAWLNLCRYQGTKVWHTGIPLYLKVIPYLYYWNAVVKKLRQTISYDDLLSALSTDAAADLRTRYIDIEDANQEAKEKGDESGIYTNVSEVAVENWLSWRAVGGPWYLTKYLCREAIFSPYYPIYAYYDREIALPVMVRVGDNQGIHYLTHWQALGVCLFFVLYGQGELSLRLVANDGQPLAQDIRLESGLTYDLGQLRDCPLLPYEDGEEGQQYYVLQTYAPAYPYVCFIQPTFLQGFITAARWWGANYRRYYSTIVIYILEDAESWKD